MELHWRSSSTPVRRRLLFALITLLVLAAAAPGAARADHGSLTVSLVRDLAPGPASSLIGSLTDLNGTLIFTFDSPQYGRELWRSDGTPAGTQLIKDINPGPAYGQSVSGVLTKYKGLIYFEGCDPTFGCELWKTDGTAAGTTRVTDAAPGSAWFNIFRMVVIGDTLFILGGAPPQGYLWISDGTAAGTVPSPLNAQLSQAISFSTAFDGRLAFADYDNDSAQVYVTDGTLAGTDLLATWPVEYSNDYQTLGVFGFVEYNGKLFFAVRRTFVENGDGFNTHELWSSDGTAAGTALLKDFGEGQMPAADVPVVSGGLLFFEVNRQLWTSDGTAAGTQSVLPSNTNDPLTNPRFFTPFNGKVYFQAFTNAKGIDLWASDGTAAGTAIVKDLELTPLPQSEYEYPRLIQGPVVFDNELYFMPKTVAEGFELWKTDGTDAGTVPVVVLNPGPADGGDNNFRGLDVIGDALFFFGNNGTSGVELFRLGPELPLAARPVALYTIDEGQGSSVQDVSGVDDPLPLQLSRSSGYTWVSGGLRLNGGTALFSAGPASKIIDAAKASNEVTVEAWVTPANVSQYSARIATISGSATRRNVSLIHGVYDTRQPTVLSARIRTNASVPDGGRALLSPNNTLAPRLLHLVFTRSADGMTRLYVDGVQVASGSRTGNLGTWDDSYRLALGGEVGGGNTWRGTFHRLAFYGRALSAAEVDANFDAGPNTP